MSEVTLDRDKFAKIKDTNIKLDILFDTLITTKEVLEANTQNGCQELQDLKDKFIKRRFQDRIFTGIMSFLGGATVMLGFLGLKIKKIFPF